MDWLPEAMRILQDELPSIEVTVSSQYSPGLADALMKGRLDLAFMRREPKLPDLVFTAVAKEPLVVILPSDHPLASQDAVNPKHLKGETFISVSNTAPVLRAVIDDYLQQLDLDVSPDHEADNISMAISLVASTRGVALLPIYALNFLPWSVVGRPIKGKAPTIDLVVGHHKANTSPLLEPFLSKIGEMIERVSKKHPEREPTGR
jgi:LysR family hca operon transcriptional activator